MSLPLSTIIPLSPAAADPEANIINLSAIYKSVVLTAVVVPFTYKLPAIVASPDTVNVANAAVPVAVNPANVPTDVNDEVITFEANVAPDNVPAGATTAAVVMDVVKPLALIVITGIAVLPPVVPADATEANVVTFPAEVTSPDKLALVVTVDALPDNDPVNPFEVTETKPAIVVLVAPNAVEVLPIVIVEFVNLLFSILPANIALVTFVAPIADTPAELIVTSPDTVLNIDPEK